MLATIKRWFSSAATDADGATVVTQWAQEMGLQAKRTREGDGVVVEPEPAAGWRLEWGLPQRHYIEGHELRLRGELPGGEHLQMLIVSRGLMETLEKQVFEQFTEGLQTRIDTDTPEEMRWLVLFSKTPGLEPRELRESFGAVAGAPQALSLWLTGPLVEALLDARRWLSTEDALALVFQRGRLTLRHALARPDPERLSQVLALYEVALREARRVGELWGSASGEPSGHPSQWSGTNPAGDTQI